MLNYSPLSDLPNKLLRDLRANPCIAHCQGCILLHCASRVHFACISRAFTNNSRHSKLHNNALRSPFTFTRALFDSFMNSPHSCASHQQGATTCVATIIIRAIIKFPHFNKISPFLIFSTTIIFQNRPFIFCLCFICVCMT
jgi:hypothetical protein